MVLTKWSLRLSVLVLIPLTKHCSSSVPFSLFLEKEDSHCMDTKNCSQHDEMEMWKVFGSRYQWRQVRGASHWVRQTQRACRFHTGDRGFGARVACI